MTKNDTSQLVISRSFNVLRQRQNVRHFADDVITCIVLNWTEIFVLLLKFCWNYFLNVGSGNGLAHSSQDAMIWTHVLVYWPMYTSLELMSEIECWDPHNTLTFVKLLGSKNPYKCQTNLKKIQTRYVKTFRNISAIHLVAQLRQSIVNVSVISACCKYWHILYIGICVQSVWHVSYWYLATRRAVDPNSSVIITMTS